MANMLKGMQGITEAGNFIQVKVKGQRLLEEISKTDGVCYSAFIKER